jgi:hypothetical protein
MESKLAAANQTARKSADGSVAASRIPTQVALTLMASRTAVTIENRGSHTGNAVDCRRLEIARARSGSVDRAPEVIGRRW